LLKIHRDLCILAVAKQNDMITIGQPHSIPRPIVATIGMFDGVHLGHRSLIEQVKQVAQDRKMATAVVTFACHPRQILRPDAPLPLLNTQEERMALLDSTGIDYAIVLNFDSQLAQLSAHDFIALLHTQYNVHTLCIGYDHRFGHNRSEGFQEYCAHGQEIGVEVVEAKPHIIEQGTISSSNIRKSLMAFNIDIANAMLGYKYRISGTVISGNQLGRTIGYPTANIQLDNPHKLLPGSGAYAVKVKLNNGNTYGGMMNIGFRPTIGGERLSAEVYLLDFSDNLYNQHITIEFVAFIRKEEHFKSLEELQRALQADEQTARKLLISS